MTTKPDIETPLTVGEIEDGPAKKQGKPSTGSAKPSAGKAKSAKPSPAKKSPAPAKPSKPAKAAKARPAASGKTAAGKKSAPAKVMKKGGKTPPTKPAKKNASPKTPKEPRKRKESVNLVRIDQNGARFTPGWQVKIRTEKLTISKWFGDKATGGEAKGKAAAIKWRDEQLASVK